MSVEEDGIKTFGARLKEQRELREVSLEEISTITKISIHLLHAMENDEWEKLPGGIFTRNFIRLYAQQLGLDAARLVEDYKHYMKSKQRDVGLDEEALMVSPRVGTTIEPPRFWFYTLLAAIILLLVGGYLVITYLRTPQEVVESGIAPEPVKVPENPPQSNQQQATTIPQEKRLRLMLKETNPQRRCWFKWWADGELGGAEEGISIPAGQEAILEADNMLRIHINHLDTVEVWLNDEKRSWDNFTIQEIRDEEDVLSFIVDVTAEALK